jgi:hypothetical protein
MSNAKVESETQLEPHQCDKAVGINHGKSGSRHHKEYLEFKSSKAKQIEMQGEGLD